VTLRVCFACKVEKHIDLFSTNRREKLGKSYRCKECSKQQSAEFREKNYSLVYARKFKTDVETIEKVLSRRVCDICGDEPPIDKRNPIDHCHTTGKIRGLLCWNCNKGLGAFRDNKQLLQKAINYL